MNSNEVSRPVGGAMRSTVWAYWAGLGMAMVGLGVAFAVRGTLPRPEALLSGLALYFMTPIMVRLVQREWLSDLSGTPAGGAIRAVLAWSAILLAFIFNLLE